MSFTAVTDRSYPARYEHTLSAPCSVTAHEVQIFCVRVFVTPFRWYRVKCCVGIFLNGFLLLAVSLNIFTPRPFACCFLRRAISSVVENDISTAKIKLQSEGQSSQQSVEMRKIAGAGMCYIHGGKSVTTLVAVLR